MSSSSSSSRRKNSGKSSRQSHASSSRDSRSRGSSETYASQSTSPTSLYASPRPSNEKTVKPVSPRFQPSVESYEEDLSPATKCHSRASVESYASTTASEEETELSEDHSSVEYECQDIPPLPMYRREIVDPYVRPTTPQEFAKLFPSTNRLSIRHDEFTSDGNMNLRVDTVATGRRKHPLQVFHLRMYDLAKRDFSLRRYGRDSGREVCNSKRKFDEPAMTVEERPTLQRSMTTAIKSLGNKPAFHRTNSGGSIFSNSSRSSTKRPGTSYSHDGDDEFANAFGRSLGGKQKRPLATNAIKLEFSNYARVDVERRGDKSHKRYEFQWWGHKYSWKRVMDKHLGIVSFHLLRDGKEKPIAHIVPETRSPDQIQTDEQAGAWVPPCHMWIEDKKIIEGITDVADVIVSTGLIALVDDCIKERWQSKRVRRINVPLTSVSYDYHYVGPKAWMHNVLSRRNTTDSYTSSPRSYADPDPTY